MELTASLVSPGIVGVLAVAICTGGVSDGTISDVSVMLRPPEQLADGTLGIGVQRIALTDVQRGPLDAVVVGLQRTIEASTLILRGIGQFLTNLSDPQVQGPVGMVTTVGLVRTEHRQLPRTCVSSIDPPYPIRPGSDVEGAGLAEIEQHWSGLVQ